jgi:hypothetical protein
MPDPSSHEPKVSLLDPAATGGIIALEGFDFQRRYALIWLIESLADPGFAALLVEGAEDVEARFDRESGPELYAVQVKNHQITTSKAKGIIEHFDKLDKASPGTWASFTIACAGLGQKAGTIHNQLQNYRSKSTGEFYTEKEEILANTRAQLETRLENAEMPADFVIERVTFEPDLKMYGQDEWVRSRALDLLQGRYPHVDRKGAMVIYLRLREIVSTHTGKVIARSAVEEAIQAVLDEYAKSVVALKDDVDAMLKLFSTATFMKVKPAGGDPTAVFAGVRRTRFAMGDRARFLYSKDPAAEEFRKIHLQLWEVESDTWEEYPEVANLADDPEITGLSKNVRKETVRAKLGEDKSDEASAFLRIRTHKIKKAVMDLIEDLMSLESS